MFWTHFLRDSVYLKNAYSENIVVPQFSLVLECRRGSRGACGEGDIAVSSSDTQLYLSSLLKLHLQQ